jgi:hypothetical protein
MTEVKPTSTQPYDYEILIRRTGIEEYASYCPQLNYMIKGTQHEEVQNKMKEYVDNYIKQLEQNPQ